MEWNCHHNVNGSPVAQCLPIGRLESSAQSVAPLPTPNPDRIK